MLDAGLLLLLPLLLLSEQAVSELVFALALLGAASDGQAALAAGDVVFEDVGRDVSLGLGFAEAAEFGHELGLFLGFGLGNGARAQGAAEVGCWFGSGLGLGLVLWLRGAYGR